MGGGSGGGGSAGAVDYPLYIKTIQADWLAATDPNLTTTPVDIDAGYDITSLLNTGFGNNPWTGEGAFNPGTYLTDILAAPDTFNTDASAAITEYENYVDSLDTTTAVEAELAAFDLGMRNVNAVHSSSYVIGRTIIASGLIREKLAAKQTIAQFKIETANKRMTMEMESNRLSIVALKEENDMNLDVDKKEALWNFELYLRASNVLASIAGGTVQTGVDSGPSTAQSAIGGGLAGAASGAMIGSAVPGIGTAAGAVIGGAIGIGQAFL